MEAHTIVVGTVGNGVWRSKNSGERFDPLWDIVPFDGIVRGFAVDPFNAAHVLCGVGYPAFGLFESSDAGGSWARVESFPPIEVWRITFDQVAPDRYFVGTRPAAIYRTSDGGASFEPLDAGFAETCPAVGVPRITSVTITNRNHDVVFVTAEVDGVRRTTDGGDTWSVVMDNITTAVPNGAVYGAEGRIDCHYSIASPGDPELVLVSTPDGVYETTDGGESWGDVPVTQCYPRQYHREMAVKLDDPSVLFLGVGEWVWGQYGQLLISRDRGRSWDAADLPEECNSPMWCFAQHPSNPDRIYACTHKGMLFRTEDGGDTWTKLRREFSEVRSMAWTPIA